jgi:hypothetical protein
MSMEQRRKPYIWPTWISPLLSGDKHCEWAAWVRAHYFYTKREETGRENTLSQWKADHARFVAEHAAQLQAEGWEVRFEDQNRFNYHGKAATVGGCPDIVAVKPGVVRIDDAKTGKPRDSDYWQVAIYGMLLPLVDESISELVAYGNVAYKDRLRTLSPQDILQAQPLIVDRIKRTSAELPPARTPSASECGFCDIADCPDRIEGESVMQAEGDAF